MPFYAGTHRHPLSRRTPGTCRTLAGAPAVRDLAEIATAPGDVPGRRGSPAGSRSRQTESAACSSCMSTSRSSPTRSPAFLDATRANATASLSEPGVLRFDVIQDLADPGPCRARRGVPRRAAAAAHKETAHYATWRDTVARMMAVPRASTEVRRRVPHRGRAAGTPRPRERRRRSGRAVRAGAAQRGSRSDAGTRRASCPGSSPDPRIAGSWWSPGRRPSGWRPSSTAVPRAAAAALARRHGPRAGEPDRRGRATRRPTRRARSTPTWSSPIGGGSAIDLAKAAAMLLANGGDPLDYIEVVGRASRSPGAAAPARRPDDVRHGCGGDGQRRAGRARARRQGEPAPPADGAAPRDRRPASSRWPAPRR